MESVGTVPEETRPTAGEPAWAPRSFALSPEAGQEGSASEVIETHISRVFLVGGYAYKLRKPVRLGFLDFSRRSDRLADCRREVALNRRLAPDVYLGVADVVLGSHPIDHMVVMRRLPASRRLSELIGENADIEHQIDEVAQRLVTFHTTAPRSAEISKAATAAAVSEDWAALFAESDQFAGSVLDAGADGEIRELAGRWLAGREPLLRSRIDDGWVCDGHGDLQADDVYCLDDGVRILDCLEFSDRLRHGDVAADVAFLVMDLERLGRTADACRLVRRYEERSGCRFPRSLLHHYCAQRAYVRATVACLRSADDPAAIERAQVLHGLCLRHLRDARVRMVLVGGLPGTGKSTLAKALAERYGWRLLRSDVIRNELFPLTPDGQTRRGRHGHRATEVTYRELLRRARASLEQGESVILDASWTDGRFRREAHTTADETSTDVIEVECTCRDEIADERMARRRRDDDDPSDATPAVRVAMARRTDPWEGPLVVDTSTGTAADTLTKVLTALPGRCELPEFRDGLR